MKAPGTPPPARWVAVMALLLAAACSTERDAFLNRTFHRLTARDNGWFNANEKLKEIVTGIEDTHIDDYDQVLPLFIYGTEDQVRSATPGLEKCIDKCSLVIERHSMEIGGEQRNTWIDDAWFVIAKSNFYKRNYFEAERGFNYIARRFKGHDRQLESEVWLARTAIQLEQYAKAQSALDKLLNMKKLPKGFDHGTLSAVQAELELKRGRVDDAIMHLERAVPLARRKRERVRWAFVLAQLYQHKGYEDKAIRQYASVVRMGPPYEMAFHAQIFQALAFNKGSSRQLRQMLNRMLRDDKHVDHFDMIHYALADLDLKDRDKPSAIDHLQTSARVSTTDVRQKAKSFLKLADLFFDDRIYKVAQKYYDSTRTLLSETHVRYPEVVTRAEVLGELVEQLDIIAREDSLQALMQLDDKELEKRIRQLIRQREDAEAEKERQELEARERAQESIAKPAGTPAGGAPRGTWYFYDPQQVARGAAEFRKRWGNRKLEDDWRRKDKSGSALAEQVEEEGMEALADAERGQERGKEAWRDPEFYLRDLPKDAEALAASNARICEALYIAGMIYKEQLKDADNAIESFENLNSRFEECRWTPESHYQLFRIYKEKEEVENYFSPDGSGSAMYAAIILERWPESEFARLVRDPNIMQADAARRAAEEEAYREVYSRYRQRLYPSVLVSCENVIANEPQNHFLAKYHLLRAMTLGSMRDGSAFRAALMEIATLFPGSDEAKAANDLLAAMDGHGAGRTPSPPKPNAPEAAYTVSNGKHYFALIVPNEGNDVTTIKALLSDFNNTMFRQPGMEITSNFLDAAHQVVLCSYFTTKAKALQFFDLFMADKEMLAGVNDQGFAAFAISPDNYSTMFRNKDVDGYSAFFQEKYLDSQ